MVVKDFSVVEDGVDPTA